MVHLYLCETRQELGELCGCILPDMVGITAGFSFTLAERCRNKDRCFRFGQPSKVGQKQMGVFKMFNGFERHNGVKVTERLVQFRVRCVCHIEMDIIFAVVPTGVVDGFVGHI